MFTATDEEWQTAYSVYADNARRHGAANIPTLESMRANAHGSATLQCLIMGMRSRRRAHQFVQRNSAPMSAPHRVGREPVRRVALDRKMLAAGEKPDTDD